MLALIQKMQGISLSKSRIYAKTYYKDRCKKLGKDLYKEFMAMLKFKTMFSFMYVFIILLLNILCVDFGMANDLIISDKQNTKNGIKTVEYRMTDAKHKLFRKENRDYALADTMLNFTWGAIKRQNNKMEFDKKLEEQRLWVEQKRDAVADSFSIHLSEPDAFTLAIVARTQELAAQVFAEPESGIYLYSSGGSAQGGHLVVNTDGISVTVQGQSFARSGNTCEIWGGGVITGDGWMTFASKESEKFFILFTKNTLYVVHGKIGLCGKKVSFQGIYKKQEKTE